MFGMIESLVQGIITGIVGPVFTYLGKRSDADLNAFQTGAQVDQVAYSAWLAAQVQIAQLKIQANGWWGPRALYMIVGGAAAVHTAAVFVDSTFTFWSGHYGVLGIPKLPEDYLSYEKMIVGSLFVSTLLDKPTSAVASWFHRK